VGEVPETRYVAVGDADVAYRVLGEGPIDLLYFFGLGSHIELIWDLPYADRIQHQLASFSRLIHFDRRGTGASDGVPRGAQPTWEQWADDVGAVLDDAGSERTAIWAEVDAGPIAILFAATHPERVSALILSCSTARFLVADDYPIGMPPEVADAIVETIASMWGSDEFVRLTNPWLATDPSLIRAVKRMLRSAATPRTAAAQFRYIMTSVDVRAALESIQAPTLVIHTRDNSFVPMEHGRYLSEHIPTAKFIEFPGSGVYVDPEYQDAAFSEMAEFLTGERPVIEVDRVLTSIMFTDIVDSTERAVVLGDRQWRGLLDAHDRLVREELRRHRGREINTTGDGFVASFDGPARGIRCARTILAGARAVGIEVRAGLHTGECEVRGTDIGGLAVHVASRVAALAEPGQVLVTATVKDLVAGSGLYFADRGEHVLKGVPGAVRLFAVTDS
jgi:class 3 adenylate cyclase